MYKLNVEQYHFIDGGPERWFSSCATGTGVSHIHLGISWRGQYYVWHSLCFGVSIAPYYFNKII